MEIRTFAGGYRANGLHRIAAERINTEYQQQDTSKQLQIEYILVDIIKDKTHSVTCQQSIGYITQRRPPMPVTKPYQRPLFKVR